MSSTEKFEKIIKLAKTETKYNVPMFQKQKQK